MPIRIAHVTNEAFGFDTANGVQHMVYALAHAQADLGESVAVFSRDDQAVNVLRSDAEAPARATVVGDAPPAWLRQRVLSRYLEERLSQQVLMWQPHIVHFHSVHIPENVALADQLVRRAIPYCVTVHGALFHHALQRHRIKKAVFDRLFERRYLNDARFVHALSPREAEVLRRHGVARPIMIVPNGLPPAADWPASRPDALYADHPALRDRRIFMFIGRLDAWQKGLDLLIEAFARARLRGAALVLIGSDYRGSRRALTSLAERRGVAGDVAFLDAAFGQDRANLFAGADLFVHPSRWEGVSLSVLAAAAAARPCLVTREADPLGELERAGAAFVVEAEIGSIADGLKRAAALGRQELRDMGERGQRAAVARFSWPSIARELAEAYRCAGESPPYFSKSSGETIRRTDSGT